VATFDGFGSFVRALEAKGELRRVAREVSPNLEIPEMADRLVKSGGPAVLFEKPTGSEFPLAINTFASPKRMAWALGVEDVEEHARELDSILKTQPPKSFMDKLKMLPQLARFASFAPKKASSGACQEVVLKEPDVTKLPVLTCWPGDGGPFITLPQVITRDPETGHRNVGCYRMQVFDAKTTAMHWQLHKVGARHFRVAKEKGEKIPVAVALGGDPALSYAATAPMPDGVDEYLLAGFLRRRGVEMVACKTVPLEVPADSDFVLEGWVDPSEPLVKEGPFGDHTGYYSLADDYPLFHVTAMTHRRDAVYPTTIVGPPPMEDAWLGKATERLFLPMIKMTLPEIVDMNLPVEGAFHNLAIVSIKKQYPGHGPKIASAIWGLGQMMFSKVIVVVEDDVDVQNVREVVWRVCANIDPKRDFHFAVGPADALDHAPDAFAYGGKVCIDATRKWKEEGYGREWPEVLKMSAEVKAKVDSIFRELGL